MAFERLHPGRPEWDAYYANHIHRYRFAAERLRGGGNVLDAACGVGYGSRFLAENGIGRIVAVDRDGEALRIARKSFTHEHVRFVQDDCQKLSEAEQHGPFDAIVSFETLEHLPDPQAFLRRCRALLSGDGRLIVSTPNANVTGGQGPREWEYHEQEYTPSELLAMLRECGFSQTELFGQCYTAIGRLRSAVRGELHQVRSNPLARVGSWVQRVLRGRPFPGAPLPEHLDDFVIRAFDSAEECDRLANEGPFVLIAEARP
ncbi:MAG: methyltransferase domain-containing protein [Planctomycetaceae bacterium]